MDRIRPAGGCRDVGRAEIGDPVWSGASDMHYPLIDNTIRKLLPFYYAQFASQDLVAKFVAGPQVDDELRAKTANVEQWFDYKIKEQNITNYIKLIADAKKAVKIPINEIINGFEGMKYPLTVFPLYMYSFSLVSPIIFELTIFKFHHIYNRILILWVNFS